MSRVADFVATVGVLLIENQPFEPWRGPVPPELAPARTWHMPTASGPLVLVVLPADGRDEARAIAEWHDWMEANRASDCALLLAYEAPPPDGPLPEFDGAWQVWRVDLGAQRLTRSAPALSEAPFFQAVDAVVGAFFRGTTMRPEDLEQEERAREEGLEPFGQFMERRRSPATFVLLAMIVALFAMTEALGGSTVSRVLIRAGANYFPLVEQGEVWRLVTANFLHIGFAHLAVNGYSLFAVGPTLEKLFGTSKFLAIYVGAGLAGAVASFSFNQGVLSAGASGALFGLLGALLVLGLRHHQAIPGHQRRMMRNLGLVMVVLNLGFGLLVPSIDNFAHLGGLLGGAALAALLGPDPILLGRKPHRWARPLLGVFPAIAALGLAVGLWYVGSNQVPAAWFEGPNRDYIVNLPLTVDRALTQRQVYLTLDDNRHHLMLESMENPERAPAGGRIPLAEPTLGAHADRLVRRFLDERERLVEPPRVIRAGSHDFLQLHVATDEGEREEVYLTASPERLYLIRTHGLTSEPWMRPALERVLASFKITSN